MGDVGVACMPLHHNNIIMEERFPVEDKPTALCSTSTTTATTTTTPIATGIIDDNNNNNNNNDDDNNNNNTTMSNQDSNSKNDGNGGSKGSSIVNGVKPKKKKITKRIIKVKRVVPVKKSSKNKLGPQGEANGSKEGVTVDNLSSVTKDLKKGVDNSEGIGSCLHNDDKGLQEDVKSSNKVDNNGSPVDKGSQNEVKTGEEINGSSISVDVELQKESKGEIEKEPESAKLSDSADVKQQNHKEEVEEGELGTLKWPPRIEIDNGEFDIAEKTSRGEFEKGQIATGNWRNDEKGEKFYGKWRKHEYVRDDFEKGEYFTDRWHSKDEYGYGKFRGRFDEGNEQTPLSGKYSGEDIYRRKEFFRIGSSHHGKTSSKWHSSQSRRTKINSKITNEESFYKGDYMNGKDHGREYSSGNRLKLHGMDPDYSEKRHHGDYLDYAGSKTRRLPEDSTRSAHSEHYSRHSVERFYKNSSSSKYSSHEKFSSRRHEPNFSSKGVFDRHGRSRSPGFSEWSPHDRAWYYDVRDPSPMRHERTPYGRERSPHGRERSHARDRSPYRRQRSPYGRERSPYSHERSPYGYNRSPYGRERSYSRERSLSLYSRERSPYSQEKSPFRDEKSPSDHSGHRDNRNRSPSYLERSPLDRQRYQDRSNQTPNYCERSPPDCVRPSVSLETSKKGEAIEKGISQRCGKIEDDKLCDKDSNNRESQLSVKESQDTNMNGFSESDEKNIYCKLQKEEKSQSPSTQENSPLVHGSPVELVSMEEDMDICDTPPHVPFVSDSSIGKWFYLDYLGVERGPSKLSELKALVDEGVLVPDYFIKHSDSDRWMTIENAVSPVVPMNFPSIVSESVTHLVNPPQTLGNPLVDTVNTTHSGTQISELPVSLSQPPLCSNENEVHSEALQDCCIEKRLGLLMEGFTITPGSELETLGEALQTTFELVEWDVLGNVEGFPDIKACDVEQNHQNIVGITGCSDMNMLEVEAPLNAICEKYPDFPCSMVSTEWFSSQWSCKGGDWKRNDDNLQDRFSRRKCVLNDGYPLSQMPKSGYEDPRWEVKDDLYYPSQSAKLDLPPWAFSCLDDRNESGGGNRPNLNKPPVSRAMRGAMLPVVRINACVVNDHGSLVSESRSRNRGMDRLSSRSVRAYSSTNDVKGAFAEYELHSKLVNDQGVNGSWKSFISINTPKDRLSTVDELQLHLGEWYFLDGTGHEQGPLSFAELQILADQGVIQKHSSIFRKLDRMWVPITSATEIFEGNCKTQSGSNHASAGDSSSNQIIPGNIGKKESHPISSTFHSLHPQFIGYTRGKLHELVMKSFKSREFAAAVNEVLEPWINVKQPKKEIDNHLYRKSEIDARAGKRARLHIGRDEDLEKEGKLILKDETSFEELCGDATFLVKENACSETEAASWGFLDGHVLSRVFHFLRSDVKSLAYASLTCIHWRAAVNFYKGISRQVDLSSIGSSCTDLIIWNIMNGYNNKKLNLMVLVGCTNVTSGMLEEILHSFPRLSSIDIRGCGQFGGLVHRFPNVRWLKDRCVPALTISEDSNAKKRSLNQITDGASVSFKTNGLIGDTDDFGNLKEYFDSVNKRDTSQLFHRSLYKRSKLFDARKSSSILSRDARMRRWSIKKTENGYRRMEWFLVSALNDIMKENILDFFVPKIAEIEDKIKSGYYVGRGLKSVKEDISRLCRNAIKAKKRVGGDMNPIITLFLRLASHLNERHKFSYERDELMKAWKEDLSEVLGSASSKYKKKLVTDRKYSSRSSVSLYPNDGYEFGDYASDREIRRRLSKLNRKSMDSGSETSEDSDRSTEDGRSNAETTASETDSDSDTRPGQTWETRGDSYFTADESIDSNTDEREWGARMTKASLVPPVTRKYEVIDQYVIVADEEDVRRKMSVSLPDDYAEKLDAQKNGTEECDMELPEVKDYKPRKELGDEVTEQEVYGIDPYTHNLLLDSMPKELGWSQLDKHMFIEDVLLCTLNKQVRHFTGTGNTPMMFPLRPVIEEIEKTADRDCDTCTMRMCRGILKAISSRPEDKYVAYRKGLGVVCNKEGGFGKDDFVVEFLGEVYPAWKWYEKQDGIRSLQKDSKEPAPEFYNIYLERPKGDGDGYDLVVVDAMHKANYASRICHSCRPNCEAKVTAVNGQYQIGIYTTRGIQYGEEITFDYNSVTESKEEYEASVCLCGSQFCRGSYLNLTGEGAFQKVLKEWHGTLDRVYLMLEACGLNSVSEEDYLDLGRAGISNCLLHGLPDWVIAYSAHLVRFINLERTKLPEAILRHNLEEKRKYFSDIDIDVERSDAEVQAEGVYNQRLQNVAITLNKVRYVMRCLFGDSKNAPPPLEKLTPEETVYFLWKGEGSLVEELLQCLAPYVDVNTLNDLKSKIREHDPLDADNVRKQLRKSLLWLRDEVRNLPCSYKCRNDAAADLIHVYAYTKCFFRVREYRTYTSPPVYISPLDLGPKHADELGEGVHEYRKTYGENYCLGQLIFWHVQTNAEPDCSLVKASRGCLLLPEIGSFYAKVQKPSQQRIYGPKTLKMMLERMEKYSQKAWPKDQIWTFKGSPKIYGSPMLDAVLNSTSLDREMLHWLKHRPLIYQAMWDR